MNVLAVVWGLFMAINLIWPRQSIYNAVEPFHWYLKWGGVLFVGIVMIGGFAYYWFVQRHKTGTLAEHMAGAGEERRAGAGGRVRVTERRTPWRSSTTSSPEAGRRARWWPRGSPRTRTSRSACWRPGRPTWTTRPSCGSRTGCSCSTPATTGTTRSSRRRRATASSATRARRCSAAARRTTRASRSGRRRRTSTSGRRWAARAGATTDTWPLIKRLETNDGPGDHHGRSGPVNLMTVPPDDPCGVAVLEAAAQAGLPTVRFNEGETVTNGAGWFQVNRSPDGTRMSSSVAYLHPIMATPVEPEGPHRLLGQAHRHRRGQARPRRRVHEPRPVHLLDGRRPPRGDPLLRVDRHAEGADDVRHRPGRAPARVRDRRARRQPGRRLQPRRPRRGHRDVGGRAADGQAVDPVVGDRPLHDDRGRPRPARPDDALRLGAVRHEHRPLGLPVGGERVLPDARTSAAAARAAPSACARPTSATACGSTRATSPTPTATTSA